MFSFLIIHLYKEIKNYQTQGNLSIDERSISRSRCAKKGLCRLHYRVLVKLRTLDIFENDLKKLFSYHLSRLFRREKNSYLSLSCIYDKLVNIQLDPLFS